MPPKISLRPNQPAKTASTPPGAAPDMPDLMRVSPLQMPKPGKLVKATLLESDKQFFATMGVDAENGLPDNMAQGLAQIRAQLAEEMNPDNIRVPGVNPDHPPLDVKMVELSSLPPEKQVEYAKALQTFVATARKEEADRKADNQTKASIAPGVADAYKSIRNQIVDKPAPEKQKPGTIVVGQLEIEDDTQAATYAGTDVPKPAPKEQTEPTQGGSSGGAALPKHCPHCMWDLSITDDAVPTEEDKTAYLDAWLGLRQFTKQYSIMQGRITMELRTISPSERDACFIAAEREAKALGLVDDNPLRMNNVLRAQHYMLAVQLTHFKSAQHDYEFPESLSDWPMPANKPGDPVPQLSDRAEAAMAWMQEHIIKSDSVLRLLWSISLRFGRLILNLEAASNDADFMQATG